MLNITNPGFQDFRTDASCTIRPQALIGEKYVDCLPTQPRVEGTPLPPPLPKIPHGQKARASTCCRSTNTHSPVDVDLLGDINRLPERQRLTIILNELGAGLAGRGSDLNVVIRRANPALQELDKVLAILAEREQGAGEAGRRLRQRARAVRARARTRRRLHRAEQHGRAGDRARTRGALAAQPRRLFPPFLRTARARDGTARALRRTDDARRSPT